MSRLPLQEPAHRRVAIVGGGPSGLTAALLLARAGHRVTVFERARSLGGLWAANIDDQGFFAGENSCKVFQSSYRSTPALLRLLGTSWERHFHARHDLARDWLRPFVADCSLLDLAKLTGAFLLHVARLRDFSGLSVADFMDRYRLGPRCRAWMRATALGGIAGTLRMTMGELFMRLQRNVSGILLGRDGVLHWNAQPPNAPEGFVVRWQRALEDLGVSIRLETEVAGLASGAEGLELRVPTGVERADAVFLALPPPALARLLRAGDPALADGFGRDRPGLEALLSESVYEHLGLAWFFDRELPRDLPLGGHNVRRGWHAILVQHSQYRAHLRAPAVTVVVGSVAIDTELLHHRLATRARDHSAEDVARILWDDERLVDPLLPEPIGVEVYGRSSATQIVRHGPLPIKARDAEVYVATSLNGHAAYFTASLESAVQAGEAAARAFDASVELLG